MFCVWDIPIPASPARKHERVQGQCWHIFVPNHSGQQGPQRPHLNIYTFTSTHLYNIRVGDMQAKLFKSFSWPEVLMWCFETASSHVSQGQKGFKETLAGVTCASNMGEKVEKDGQMAYFKMIILSVFQKEMNFTSLSLGSSLIVLECVDQCCSIL